MGTPLLHTLFTHTMRPLRHTCVTARALWMVVLLVISLVSVPSLADARTYASFVMDAGSGKVLYARNADKRTYPASLTKMMTLYLLFEDLQAKRITMRTPLKVTARAARQPSSKLGLRRGQVISVNTAIKALVIKSANDVAVTVAENLARSEVAFARRMTNRARALGMRNTTFRNASGLYHSKQKSTARDMAKLGQALQRDFPQYYKYFAQKSFRYNGKTIRTHNKLLKTYSGADGMKTGYIHASGFNIVTSAVRSGKRIISVVLGGNSSKWRDQHIARLMNRAFQDIAFAENNIPRPPLNPENKRLLAALGTDEGNHGGIAPENLTIGQGDAEDHETATIAPIGRGSIGMLAMATPTPSAPRTRISAKTNWAVQVGAFGDRKSAQKAAKHAMTLQTDKAAHLAKRVVQPIISGKRTLYRARLTQLTAKDAYRTCRLLQRDSRPCLTIKTR